MRREQLVQLVCAGYCSFYKPGKDSELACNGFTVAQKLIGKCGELAFEKGDEQPASAAEHDLFHAVCRQCSFFESDCDFAAWKQGESPAASRGDVKPCGGILFLAGAIGRGRIDVKAVTVASGSSTVNHS